MVPERFGSGIRGPGVRLGRCHGHGIVEDCTPMDDAQVCRHFSLGNPKGPSGSDLPLLLRRLADVITEKGIAADELLDVTIGGDEVNEHGVWWRATVYWAPDDAAESS